MALGCNKNSLSGMACSIVCFRDGVERHLPEWVGYIPTNSKESEHISPQIDACNSLYARHWNCMFLTTRHNLDADMDKLTR